MARRLASPDPDAVNAYIAACAEPASPRLGTLRAAIREEAPGATERIAYGLPTWHQGENLIHLGAFTHHIGIYPGPEAIVAFAGVLAGFTTSKGAVQVPHDAPLPVGLVRDLVRWRLGAAARRASRGADGC